MKYTLLNSRLFLQKLTALAITTLLLIPLVYYKLHVPAFLYVVGLLVLHVFFMYLYFSQTPWRQLLHSKSEFTIRAAAVAFFIYLLTLVKFEGNSRTVITRLLIAMGLHVAILAGMMVVHKKRLPE